MNSYSEVSVNKMGKQVVFRVTVSERKLHYGFYLIKATCWMYV